MAGETIKSRAVCLRISPWSRTSHVVVWLTPSGRIATVVKGAARPKSAFLGQYDLNYTCEIVYYARERAEARALKECSPLALRDELRGDWRSLAAADRLRSLAEQLSPNGPDAGDWFDLLESGLDGLAGELRKDAQNRRNPLAFMLDFELKVLNLAGLAPEMTAEGGAFSLRGERKLGIPPGVARCLADPLAEKNLEILLDAARAIGVFYAFHLDQAVEGRRQVLGMVSQPKRKRKEKNG